MFAHLQEGVDGNGNQRQNESARSFGTLIGLVRDNVQKIEQGLAALAESPQPGR